MKSKKNEGFGVFQSLKKDGSGGSYFWIKKQKGPQKNRVRGYKLVYKIPRKYLNFLKFVCPLSIRPGAGGYVSDGIHILSDILVIMMETKSVTVQKLLRYDLESGHINEFVNVLMRADKTAGGNKFMDTLNELVHDVCLKLS